MRLSFFKSTVLILLLASFSCGSNSKNSGDEDKEGVVIHDTLELKEDETLKTEGGEANAESSNRIIMGAEQPEVYTKLLMSKNIGIVANQTSMVTQEDGKQFHLVDYMISHYMEVKKVFAPEHGFRGKADAGELIQDGIDTKTKLPIISLYGKDKKPSQEMLEGLDAVVFDIQDVGARFYTYISTLHYVMEACAEAGIPVYVLDRPNPNGHYIDGPILEPEHTSFVGMHPVPVVHGMTIGEYAQMINGEGWLDNAVKCDLTVIQMKHYDRQKTYALPIKPSPNLPNDKAINLYPSLCFFEGTIVSAGRGTENQFQIFGAPSLPSEFFPFTFTPQPNEGAKYPKFDGKQCQGMDLREHPNLNRINLEWLIEAYVGFGKKATFFNDYFTTLAGTKKLQQQIEQGYTYKEIRATWLRDLDAYDSMRKKYLLYN